MTSVNSGALLAQLDLQPLWEDHGLPLAIMGLVVVFAALTLLRIFIGTLPRIMAALEYYYPEQEESSISAPQPTLAAQPTNELPEEILVVIAAAVAATVLEPHRIIHMRQLSADDMSWSLEGRRQHHASHKIQPRNPS